MRFLTPLLILCLTSPDGRAERQNSLRPFTSDGCSRFFDGSLASRWTSWRHCCVIHDLAYWKGGTRQERVAADTNLHQCVQATGATKTADLMWAGVAAFGSPRLPFTWRWGYGWLRPRSYKALNAPELAQTQYWQAQIPKDFKAIPIQSQPILAKRGSLTGSYCWDEAIGQIEDHLGDTFTVIDESEATQSRADGFWKTIRIEVDRCREPFRFQFLVLTRDGCESPATDWVVNARVRLLKAEIPRSCSR